MGAAVQAGIIAGEITDLILLDVTPLSLGVETLGGLMTTVINRNASIPVKQSEVFSTGADFQDTVEIHVLQGERPLAKDNKSLGIFKLKDIPSAPRGVPKISVTFQLDVNGLLSVSAREEKSGQEQSIKIEGASVLPREDVSKMIQEAEENSKLDKTKKALINMNYEFDNLLAKSEKIIELFSSSQNLQDEELAEKQRKADEEKAIDDNVFANKQRNLAATTGLLRSVSELVGKETAAGKALAVASSLIDTYAAITSTIRAAARTPAGGIPGYAIAQGIAVGIAGLLAVKNILKVKVPNTAGGGSGGVSVPTTIAAPVAPQAETTTLNQGQINQIGNAAGRAFVVESDITNNQEKIRRLNRQARIN
jgi:hypothetical protein